MTTTEPWLSTSFVANDQVAPFAGTKQGSVTVDVIDLPVGVHTADVQFTFVDDTPEPATHTVTVTIQAGFHIIFNGANSNSEFAEADEEVNVNEGGSFTTKWGLRSKPNDDVTFTFTGDATPQGFTISPDVITFTPSDWSTLKEIVITSTPNDVVDFDRSFELGVSVTTSDAGYAALSLPKYTISISDNDSPGIFVSQTTFALTEGDETGHTFTLNIQTEPTHPVQITFASHQQFTITPAQFTFTDTTPQDFTIVATNDNVVEGTMVIERPLGTITTDDPAYAAFTLPTLSVTITDDDLLVLTSLPPTGPEDGETEVLVHLKGTVTLDPASITYPGFTLINKQENPNHVWAGAGSDEFLRNIECVWGSHASAKVSGALVQGPRTLKCITPSCSLDDLNAFKRCVSPVDVRLRVNNQHADGPYPQFYYYWSPQHDVITPENQADEVWRSAILGINPTSGPMHEETEITITGTHFGVETMKQENADSIALTEPAVKMDGYLCSGTRWVDPNNHDLGIVTYTPKRKDLEGTSKTIEVTFQISFNSQNYWGDSSIKFGYYDWLRSRTSLAWTVFFVVANGAFLIFFLYVLKGWLCANFCERCQKADDVEDEGELEILGPKAVSEYLEKKILARLLRDRDVLRAYRQAAEQDAALKTKLGEAGFEEEWEDEDEMAERKRMEQLTRDTEAKVAKAAKDRNTLGKKQTRDQEVEMASLGDSRVSVVPSADDRPHQRRMQPFEVDSSEVQVRKVKAAPSSSVYYRER